MENICDIFIVKKLSVWNQIRSNSKIYLDITGSHNSQK